MVELTPYSFWGGSLAPLQVERSKISVVLDAPKSERAKRNQIDIQSSFHSTKLKKTTRYIIERAQGKVLNKHLWRLLFVYDETDIY